MGRLPVPALEFTAKPEVLGLGEADPLHFFLSSEIDDRETVVIRKT